MWDSAWIKKYVRQLIESKWTAEKMASVNNEGGLILYLEFSLEHVPKYRFHLKATIQIILYLTKQFESFLQINNYIPEC